MHTSKVIASILFLLVSIVLTNSPSQAAILVVDGDGQLTGARNVNVNGTLFNVVFSDGPCTALFDGCNENSDFDFQNESDAVAAALALLDQVFLDVTEGLFDTIPGLTLGCEHPIECGANIPYQLFRDPQLSTVFIASASALNTVPPPDGMGDALATGTIGGIDVPLDRPTMVFARFTPISPVPEPGTLALFACGIAGVGVMKRRRKIVMSSEAIDN